MTEDLPGIFLLWKYLKLQIYFFRVKMSYLEKLWVRKVYKEYGCPNNFKSQTTDGKVSRLGRYLPDYYIHDPNDSKKILEIG